MLGVFVISILAGTLGALLGLGGGIILVPALILLLGVPEKTAVATSLLGVIATSVTASISHLRYRYANICLGMWLTSGTVVGALAGSLLFQVMSPRWIALLFALMQGYVAWALSRPRPERPAEEQGEASFLCQPAQYVDFATGQPVRYVPQRFGIGWLTSVVAGALSAILGVGGGIINLPVMNLLMNVPLKAAAATSSFMIGITGSISATIYLLKGYVDPGLAAPSVLGVMAGAHLGASLSRRLRSRVLRNLLIVILVISAARMAWRAL
ncbi:MAG: sulfite exporter TauE/SafE family protein [Armatimonadota bacterium]|nr:sulfite exporter TauE/SafE family protein [Armatimonadota bacterium]MDW8105026.1 sulfite exporter TauE/SafE family protein [Armatimonadota bacterium]